MNRFRCRIARSLERHGDKFARRILTDPEWEEYQNSSKPVLFLAGRFAAKEAVVKAMGTGFSHGMWIRDCGVVQNEWGKPELVYSARGLAMCRKLGIGEGHVSLTDEAGLVVAVAVLMRAFPMPECLS